MSAIVILSSQAHRDLHLARRAPAHDAHRFVPVVASEFSRLAVQCPIFLSKDSETGAFYFGAMLGFDEGENLLAAEWDTLGGYRPLNLRRRPFFISGDQLAVDLDDPALGPSGDPLFEADGAPAERLLAVRDVFGELRAGLDPTRAFVEDLVRLRLVTPIELDLAFDDGVQLQLEDLYTIDQGALRELPDATVLEWFRNGRLFLVHLLIASVRQVSALANRRNRAGASIPTGADGWA